MDDDLKKVLFSEILAHKRRQYPALDDTTLDRAARDLVSVIEDGLASAFMPPVARAERPKQAFPVGISPKRQAKIAT